MSMPKKSDNPTTAGDYLAKRQQQIMEIVYRRGEADVATVMEDLPDPLTNPAVRAHLRALEEKGHLQHTELNGKFIYQPTKPRQTAARSALMGLVQNLFHGSVEGVMTTLLSAKAADLTDEDLEHLKTIIDDAKNAKAADHAQDA
jgi:BlaI family penicillinase repressor